MPDQQVYYRGARQVAPPAPLPPARPETSRRELRQAIQGSNQVLASATTVFALFPDTLTVDRAMLTLTKRQFFSTAEVMSIRIEDVLNVTATVGPFFGSLKIVSRVMNTEKPYMVSRFWRSDALRLKRIIQGYVIAVRQGIDCSALPSNELSLLLDRLGEDEHPTA